MVHNQWFVSLLFFALLGYPGVHGLTASVTGTTGSVGLVL